MKQFLLAFFLLGISASAATVNVTDSQFAGGAVGDLRTCADMQMTSGSTTLYSPAQCNFTSADVGKWVQVPFAGDAYGTGLSAQISGFTDSQHVTLSVMAGENANSGTTGTIGTGNYTALAAVATYACANPNTTVNWAAGSYYIEKYKIIGGGSANGITDIVWNGCSGTINTGYGASVVSNGAYRQLNDDSGYSYEQTVSPFHVTVSTMTIEGLEINGSVEETTMASVAEGRSLGIVTDTSTVTLKDLNVHSFPVDCLELGLNSIDTNDVVTNVSVHACGRQGLTVANVAGLVATNYQCQQIGADYTGGYGGHAPENCVDVEPAIAPPASGLVFTGGSYASANGSLFSISGATDIIIQGGTFDCTAMNACQTGCCYLGGISMTFNNNTVYGGFSCGVNSYFSGLSPHYVTNNQITSSGNNGVTCHDLFDTMGIPFYFNGNHITVTGTANPNGSMQFWYIKEAHGNTFSLSKNAQFPYAPTNAVIIDYKGTGVVFGNTYGTDLSNLTYGAYGVNYTGVNLACGEVSQEPTYFVVTGGNAPCPPTTTGAGVIMGAGVTQ